LTDSVEFEDRLAGFKSARYPELRPPQARALEGYSRDRREADLAIELPTGYGKTLVALLIADLALEDGQTVAYLAGLLADDDNCRHPGSAQELIQVGPNKCARPVLRNNRLTRQRRDFLAEVGSPGTLEKELHLV